MKLKLTKNNGEDIGFANSVLISSIITFNEFKKWLYYVIEYSEDTVPTYFFDILDIEEKFDYTLKIAQIVGFYDGGHINSIEEKALCGIGYIRFPEYKSDYVTKKDAIEALSKLPYIEKRFRDMFPFIEW